MNGSILFLLQLAEGPLFRCAFALLVLGLLRLALLSVSDAIGGYLTARDAGEFWRKAGQRGLALVSPALVLGRARLGISRALFAYHIGLNVASLVFRLGVLLVPTFMVAHVYLWERGLGISWPALPGRVADVLAGITIAAGVLAFLGRIYSPLMRRTEPVWTFFKPLILLAPFITGFLAMHPTWSPIDYHVMRFLHIVSACVVFILVPFTRLLAYLHTPLTQILPEAAWSPAPVDDQVQTGRAPDVMTQ
jgi:nitrate reductase gamma subunit